MSTRSSATRYARALFDVALQESIVERAEQDLSTFATLLTEHPSLQNALTHPAIPAARKRGLAAELTSRLQLATPVAKVLVMLAERDRIAVLPDLLDVYRERLLDHQQVIRAEVTTAEAISAEILGGAVTRIGSTVYDGSLAAQLVRLRERLSSAH